jgi:hypothetical protein
MTTILNAQCSANCKFTVVSFVCTAGFAYGAQGDWKECQLIHQQLRRQQLSSNCSVFGISSISHLEVQKGQLIV